MVDLTGGIEKKPKVKETKKNQHFNNSEITHKRFYLNISNFSRKSKAK